MILTGYGYALLHKLFTAKDLLKLTTVISTVERRFFVEYVVYLNFELLIFIYKTNKFGQFVLELLSTFSLFCNCRLIGSYKITEIT